MRSYILVTAQVGELAQLTNQVNNLIKEGYAPLGGPVPVGSSIIQALTLVPTTDETPKEKPAKKKSATQE